MTFSYTEIFKAASPLRGGTPVGSMGGGVWGTDGAITAGGGLMSTTLSSVKIVQLTAYSQLMSGLSLLSISSNGMIDISTLGAASGSWMTYGI